MVFSNDKINHLHYSFSGAEKEFKDKMQGYSISEIVIHLYEKYSKNGHLEKTPQFYEELNYAKNLVRYDRLPHLRENINHILYWLKDHNHKKISPEKKVFIRNNLEKIIEVGKDFNTYIRKHSDLFKKDIPEYKYLEEIIKNEEREENVLPLNALKKKELALSYIKLPPKQHIPLFIMIKELKHPQRFAEKVARRYIKHLRAQRGKCENNHDTIRNNEESMQETFLRINDIMGIQIVYLSCDNSAREDTIKENRSVCEKMKEQIIRTPSFKKWSVKDFFQSPKGYFDGAIKIVARPIIGDYSDRGSQADYIEIQITDLEHFIRGEIGKYSHATIYEQRQKQFEKSLSRKEKEIYYDIREIGEELLHSYWDDIRKD